MFDWKVELLQSVQIGIGTIKCTERDFDFVLHASHICKAAAEGHHLEPAMHYFVGFSEFLRDDLPKPLLINIPIYNEVRKCGFSVPYNNQQQTTRLRDRIRVVSAIPK